MDKIHFFKRKEIDDHRWDEVINQSSNSLPYAYSWYLDAVAENWIALVLNDYEAVMPLVWLRKLGVKCVYQPYYCQQLGLFSLTTQSAEVHRLFLAAANERFSYIDTNLNPAAACVASDAGVKSKTNLLLDLKPAYRGLVKNYAGNQKRNIAKAIKAELVFTVGCELKAFQNFYLENVNRQKENFKPKHEKIFKKLSHELVTGGMGTVFTARDSEDQLYAAVLIIHHLHRLIAIINTSSAAGKRNGASHFLFDQIIQKFSNSDYTLDFEGSSIPTIARFYLGFGARPEIFYNYKSTVLKELGKRFG